MKPKWNAKQLADATVELLRANEVKSEVGKVAERRQRHALVRAVRKPLRLVLVEIGHMADRAVFDQLAHDRSTERAGAACGVAQVIAGRRIWGRFSPARCDGHEREECSDHKTSESIRQILHAPGSLATGQGEEQFARRMELLA